jgi:hypothetical protein
MFEQDDPMILTRTTRRTALALLTTLHLATGCATGDPPPANDPDAGGSGGRDAAADVRVEPDVPDVPDVSVEEEETGPPQICLPGFADCTDDGQVVACNDDGTEFITTPCSGNQECRGGECLDPIICQQGERRCVTTTEFEECRPGGTAFRVVQCQQDQTCIGGDCVSGEPNGGDCAEDGDCAGALCHCGAGTDDACGAQWDRAYCSAGCTTANDCADDELCMAGDVHLLEGAAANVNHCVKKCQGTCVLDGLSCKRVPAYDENGDQTFGQGCYFDAAVEVGGECETDTECVGGFCLKGYFNTGYCTSPCGPSGCPDNAACVRLDGSNYTCSLLCGDGSVGSTARCPLEPTPADDRFDVACDLRQTFDGPALRVCANPT